MHNPYCGNVRVNRNRKPKVPAGHQDQLNIASPWRSWQVDIINIIVLLVKTSNLFSFISRNQICLIQQIFLITTHLTNIK
jgi:hypothetical protein